MVRSILSGASRVGWVTPTVDKMEHSFVGRTIVRHVLSIQRCLRLRPRRSEVGRSRIVAGAFLAKVEVVKSASLTEISVHREHTFGPAISDMPSNRADK